VLDQIVMLLVSLVRLLLEGDLLVGVRGVPLCNQRTDNVAVVLALDVGDGTAAVEIVGGIAATGLRSAPAAAAAGGERQGENAGSSYRQ
jgi:hypothetical protein